MPQIEEVTSDAKGEVDNGMSLNDILSALSPETAAGMSAHTHLSLSIYLV